MLVIEKLFINGTFSFCLLKLEHFASATRYQFRAGLKAKDVPDLVDARGNVKYARRTGWFA